MPAVSLCFEDAAASWSAAAQRSGAAALAIRGGVTFGRWFANDRGAKSGGRPRALQDGTRLPPAGNCRVRVAREESEWTPALTPALPPRRGAAR